MRHTEDGEFYFCDNTHNNQLLHDKEEHINPNNSYKG